MSWNPRYACYAAAHGHTPEQQLEADQKRWPGGCMTGFIFWNNDRIREFAKLCGFQTDSLAQLSLRCLDHTYFSHRPTRDIYKAYDRWLRRKYSNSNRRSDLQDQKSA